MLNVSRLELDEVYLFTQAIGKHYGMVAINENI